MATRYRVEVLTPKEWQRIVKSDARYQEVNDDNLGFADPVKRVGYVRHTTFPELTRYLVNHEFEHLLETEGTDEDAHGIRHKRGFLRNAAAVLSAPFTGGTSLLVGSDKQRPVVGSPGGALNNVANSIYQVAAPIVGGILGAPFGPAGVGVGSGLGSALGNAATGQRAVGKKALVTGATAGGGAAVLQGLGGVLGSGGATATGQTAASGAQQTASGTLNVPMHLSAAPTGAASTGAAAAPSTSSALGAGIRSPLRLPTSALAGAQGSGSGPLGAIRLPSGPSTFPMVTPGAATPAAVVAPSLSPALASANNAAAQSRALAAQGGGGQRPGPLSNLFGGGGGGGNPPPVAGPRPFGTAPTGVGPTGGGAPPTAPAAQGPLAQLGITPQVATGAGISLLGNALGGQPQVPDLGNLESIQNLRANAGGANSDLGRLAQTRLSERLTQDFPGLTGDVEEGIKNTYQRQREALISQFKSIRPNADLTTDSAYRQALNELASREADTVAQARQTEFTRFQAERTQDISTALGIDSQTLQQLTELAGLDIQTIAAQLQLDAESARSFKETFGNIGSLIATGGMPQLPVIAGAP